MWRVAEIKFVKLEIHRESRNRRTWQTQGTTIIYLFDLTYKKSIIYAKKFGFVFFLTHPKKKKTFLPKNFFFLSLIFADLISPSGATHCAQKSPPKEKPYPNYLYPPHPLTPLSFFFCLFRSLLPWSAIPMATITTFTTSYAEMAMLRPKRWPRCTRGRNWKSCSKPSTRECTPQAKFCLPHHLWIPRK